MFQTAIVHWLQSVVPPLLGALLRLVTTLGYAPTYFVLLLILLFGVRFRSGMLLAAIVLLNLVVTESLKRAFAFPRPSDVDPTVAVAPPDSAPAAAAPGPFWSLPAAEPTARVRAEPAPSFGLPSGHVSNATAFLVGFALIARRRRLLPWAAVWVGLMALSRMYLGRHFLGDVLGGLAVGLLSATIGTMVLGRADAGGWLEPDERRWRWLLLPVGVLVAGLAMVSSRIEPASAGLLVGLTLAWMHLRDRPVPADEARAGVRAARVLLGAAVCAVLALPLLWLMLAHPGLAPGLTVAAGALLGFGLIVGTVAVARRVAPA